MKTVIVVLFALLSFSLVAQERPTPRKPIAKTSAAPPAENLSIVLTGSLIAGPSVNLEVVGIGPVFKSQYVVGDQGTIVECEYLVEDGEKGLAVSYSISHQIKELSHQSGNSKSVRFRDIANRGKVLCEDGKAITILRNGDRELQLTVSRLKKE